MGDGRGVDGSDGSSFASTWCNWSDDPEILQALLEEFRGAGVASDRAGGAEGDGGEGKGVEGDSGGEGEGEEEDDGRSNVHMHLSEVREVLGRVCS